MDANIAMVLVAITGIVVPLTTLLLTYVQNKRIADDTKTRAADVATKFETVCQLNADNAVTVDAKLDGIHHLVNSQLSEAVYRFNQALAVIDDLKQMLLLLAPDDPRVQAMAGRNTNADVNAAAAAAE